MRIRILDRWIIGRFLKAWAIFVLSALLLFLVIDVFSNVDSLMRRGLLTGLVERYGTMLPELFFTLSPHLALMSGIWTVVSLQRSNELVPLLAAGYSTRRLALPMLIASACLALLTWADRELLLPSLSHLRRARQLKQDRESVRPVPDGKGGVLSARYYLPGLETLQEARFVQLDERGGEAFSIIAARSVYEDGGWRFYEGVVIEPTPDGDRITRIAPEGYLLQTRIRLSDVEAAIDAPTYLSAAQLRAQLERTPGFKHLEIQLYERFTQPLGGLILLLAALPLVFGISTGSSPYLRVLVCLGMGIVYFFAGAILYELGSRGVLSPFLAAATPLLVFAVLGALLSVWQEGWPRLR